VPYHEQLEQVFFLFLFPHNVSIVHIFASVGTSVFDGRLIWTYILRVAT